MPIYFYPTVFLVLAAIVAVALIYVVNAEKQSKLDHLNLSQELTKQVTAERLHMRSEFEDLIKSFQRQVDAKVASTNQAIGAMHGAVNNLGNQVGGIATHLETTAQQSVEDLHAKVDALGQKVDDRTDAIGAAVDGVAKAVAGQPNTPEKGEGAQLSGGAGNKASAPAAGDAQA